MRALQKDKYGKDMGIGLGGIIGAAVGLGVLAATTNIMLSTLDKQRHLQDPKHNPYHNYRALHNVHPTMQRVLPGIYREFPQAGQQYAFNMDNRLNRMVRK